MRAAMNGRHYARRWPLAALAASLLFLTGYAAYRWVTGGPVGERANRRRHARSAQEPATLSQAEAARIRGCAERMMNPQESAAAFAELHERLTRLLRRKAPQAPLAMAMAVEALAPQFASLDHGARYAALGLLADVMVWHGKNRSATWASLLAPARRMIEAGLQDSSVDLRLAALRLTGSCWQWQPPGTDSPAHRKRLSTWRSRLAASALPLLKDGDEQVRAEAALTVASSPDESLAASAGPLLNDESPKVRRCLLLGLAERPSLLPSEQIVPLLNDDDWGVAATADLVLRCRGVSREEIALAKRVTHRSVIVRVQAPQYVLASTTVDRVVWLTRLSEDESAEVRAAAVRALAAVGGTEAVARLRQVAERDADQSVRELASRLAARSFSGANAGSAPAMGAANNAPPVHEAGPGHAASRPLQAN